MLTIIAFIVALALLMEGRQADSAETAPDPQPGPPTLPEP